MKKWREANREHHAELRRRWREANRERITAYNHQYYDDNREREIERSLAYIKTHPEVNRAINQRRTALKREAICEHGPRCVTAAFLKAIRAGVCEYCGDAAAHADHVQPLSRGGLHCVENIVPACVHCNTSKWASDVAEWVSGRGSRSVA